jgi:hypothetical protein
MKYCTAFAAFLVSFIVFVAGSSGLRAQSITPGLGPAGNLAAIDIEQAGEPVLHGRDSRMQLLVTGRYASGQRHDLTRSVAYSVAPTDVVQIDDDGFVTPVGDGAVTVTAKAASGQTATFALSVDQIESEIPINFANQIVPIFTKLGCNTGACHGKSTGQNGFRMSLLGFYPAEDYDFLVKDQRGRRIFPSSPEYSLLLLKSTNTLPHGGGRRLAMDSLEGELILRWIAQGMPFGSEEDRVVKRIEVFPKTRTMNRGGDQQLTVIAHYSDGSSDDVTRMVKYESNDLEMAEVTSQGVVKTLDMAGEATVMVRFQDFVSVFRAIIPLGVKFQSPPAKNFVDQHVFAKLQTLGIPPSPLCDDATFMRRVCIDITGSLPMGDAVSKFLADKDPNKRDKLIDQLLASPRYADYFASKWNSVLRNQRTTASGKTVTFGFHKFVRDSMASNVPYTQFVRTLLTASGDTRNNPAANWFAQVSTPVTQAEDVAQLFLGLRIQCAHCHHHPYEKWTQDDYFGLTAFFSRVKRQNGKQKKDRSMIISHNPGAAKMVNTRTGKDVLPTALGGEPLQIDPKQDPRVKLVEWMTTPENPFFAKALVNRYWRHFFGRGIIDPEDDMRVTNPPSNPQLLAALEQSFIKSNFDLKQLVRTICRSRTYQLDSEPNDYNADDQQNFSRYYAKRLNAEVLFDALNQVTNTTTKFKDLPDGTRAIQLPDNSFDNYFLSVFGRPKAQTACECERSADANLAQSLHMLNSPEVQAKLAAKGGRAELLAADEKRSHLDKVTELYHWALGRSPQQHEIELILPHLEDAANKKQAYEDVLWALINTKEFLFSH